MKAIGMIVVVMMVSRLRMMWRSERRVRMAVSPKKCRFVRIASSPKWLVIACSLLVIADIAGVAVRAGADHGEEDVLEGRLLLDVFDLRGREQLPEFGQGAVHD